MYSVRVTDPAAWVLKMCREPEGVAKSAEGGGASPSGTLSTWYEMGVFSSDLVRLPDVTVMVNPCSESEVICTSPTRTMRVSEAPSPPSSREEDCELGTAWKLVAAKAALATTARR